MTGIILKFKNSENRNYFLHSNKGLGIMFFKGTKNVFHFVSMDGIYVRIITHFMM